MFTARARRRAILSVVLLAVGLVALLVRFVTPSTIDGLSVATPRLETYVGASSALVRAEVETVRAGSSPSVYELTIRVRETEWVADARTLVGGHRANLPDLRPGDVLEAYTWASHEYVEGRTYRMFLGYSEIADAAEDYPLPPWVVSLGFDGPRAVDGVAQEVRQDILDLLAPGETLADDGIQAVLELAIEQVRMLDARNAGRSPGEVGPRTRRLQAARERRRGSVRGDIELSRWMETPPERRFLGVAEADIPAGAADELGVAWVDALALVLYDPADAPLLDRLVVVTREGHGLISPLPRDRTALLLPFVKARGSWLAVGSWPRSADGYDLLTAPSEVAGTEVDAQPRLVIDLRGSSVELRTVDAEEFDDLVMEHRP